MLIKYSPDPQYDRHKKSPSPLQRGIANFTVQMIRIYIAFVILLMIAVTLPFWIVGMLLDDRR